jgi:hypothetical protein
MARASKKKAVSKKKKKPAARKRAAPRKKATKKKTAPRKKATKKKAAPRKKATKKKAAPRKEAGSGRAPRVTVDGRARPVESATLELSLQTEAWSPTAKEWLYGPEHLAVDASLAVRVDERSGEDGALAPEAQSIPIVRAAGGRPPAPDALPGLVVDDQDDWDAWFGNDAPTLDGNRLVFGPWVARDAIEVDWTATYGSARRPLRVSGPVRFAGLSLMVKAPEDEAAFLEQTFGAAALTGLRRVAEEAVDFGPGMPAGRRHWTRVRYERR